MAPGDLEACVIQLTFEAGLVPTTNGEMEGDGGTQSCIQAKSTRHPRGGCGAKSHILYFYFFPVKIKTDFKRKTVNRSRKKDNVFGTVLLRSHSLILLTPGTAGLAAAFWDA